MTSYNVPAILSKCACEDFICPNQILWINKDKLVPHGDYEVDGCVPIASFTPKEIDWFLDTFIFEEEDLGVEKT